jgi:hypothetical protein
VDAVSKKGPAAVPPAWGGGDTSEGCVIFVIIINFRPSTSGHQLPAFGVDVINFRRARPARPVTAVTSACRPRRSYGAFSSGRAGMDDLAVWAVPGGGLARYELRIDGVPARDGDFAALYGDCGDGSAHSLQYILFGSAGGTLRLILRCRSEGVLGDIVFDGAFRMPANVDCYESGKISFRL